MPKRYPASLLLALVAVLTFTAGSVFAKEQADVEKLVQKLVPPLAVKKEKIEEKDRFYFDAYYEPGNVLVGTRTGHWNELDFTYGYVHRNITGYMYVSEQERFDEKDYTANWGAYINMDKDQYVHMEAGFGWDINFIYQLQTIAEYGHRLYENLFGQINYTYRAYRGDDTHLVVPTLIYYFGDSYISTSYGTSYMESHDTANLGVFKGDFAITNFLRWNCGMVVGRRLYDINGFDAKDEFGYILFTGINLNIYKGINFRCGYSYGTEEPKFIKRSIYFAASLKF